MKLKENKDFLDFNELRKIILYDINDQLFSGGKIFKIDPESFKKIWSLFLEKNLEKDMVQTTKEEKPLLISAEFNDLFKESFIKLWPNYLKEFTKYDNDFENYCKENNYDNYLSEMKMNEYLKNIDSLMVKFVDKLSDLTIQK